jgi:aldose 1-epimerase
MPVTTHSFGNHADGDVSLYELTSDSGISAAIMNYGATLVSLKTPDRESNYRSIVLRHDSVDDYLKDGNFLGAIAGRYANRIAGAAFSLNGKAYKLMANNGDNQLHGGPVGFNKALWRANPYQDAGGSGIRLGHFSPDLDQGFPGNLSVTADYHLSNEGILRLTLGAETDRPTVVNLTSHSYFNLHGQGDVGQHKLKLFADAYTPVGDGLIPTGEIVPVANGSFDFRAAKEIGQDLHDDHPQLVLGGGYDHNFVVADSPGALRAVAEVSEPVTGRRLWLASTQPGVQFYSGNNLSGKFQPQDGFCLETQHFPNSPNQKTFPSTTVLPEKPYQEIIEYRFAVRAN